MHAHACMHAYAARNIRVERSSPIRRAAATKGPSGFGVRDTGFSICNWWRSGLHTIYSLEDVQLRRGHIYGHLSLRKRKFPCSLNRHREQWLHCNYTVGTRKQCSEASTQFQDEIKAERPDLQAKMDHAGHMTKVHS